MAELSRVIASGLKLIISLSLVSCDGASDDGAPPWPGSDDPRYTVEVSRSWLMVGDGLTPADERFVLTIGMPSDETIVEIWVDDDDSLQFERSADAPLLVEIDVTQLEIGEHVVVLSTPNATSAFARRTFTRSHALYLVMATDWDDPDNDQRWLDNMDELRDLHPGLRYTQYFGPYSLTDPAIAQSRRDELIEWLIARRDAFGDEIGVHLHTYCSFVDTTSVDCRTEPSFAYEDGVDPSGYTIIVASYTTEEMTELLQTAADLFEANGLGRPVSFRAGGWTADATTTAALEATGYTVQADAIVASAIEEWEGRGTLYEWLMDHWGTITTTHQPYYPSRLDLAAEAHDANAFPVLQVPANAVIVDYVWESEIIDIFDENFPNGAALPAPTVVHTGLHPTNFGDGFLLTLHTALSATVDDTLYANDDGPVVYATAGELVAVYEQ